MNWNYILEYVKKLEKKIDRLISQNLNPFHLRGSKMGRNYEPCAGP